MLVRVMEQAVQNGIISVNPARVTGWQKLYKQAEDELRDPHALTRSTGIAAFIAARIGEVSGCRVQDIDTGQWIRTVRRQTTPAPGGLTDKGTEGKRARRVPIIQEIPSRRPATPAARDSPMQESRSTPYGASPDTAPS
ncbi:hypothetical protein OG350_31950 [Streptomyces achromogenes]|uniref:Integrase n=1 Tax=Streptomyces achromogenes TaxID=67255 RepID=A0ABZ1KZY8_STRAH